MIKLNRIIKDYRDTGAVNEVVNLHGFVDDHTFHTKSGDLGVVLKMAGVDYECLDSSQLDELARRFEAAIRIFDEKFRVYQYLIKRDEAPLPHRDDYDDTVVRQAISNRISHLRDERDQLFKIEIFFVVLFEGGSRQRSFQDRAAQILKDPSLLFTHLGPSRRVQMVGDEIDRGRAALTNKVNSFLIQIREHIAIELLEKSAAFQFLRMLLNYTQYKADGVRLKHDTFLDYFTCDSAIECHRDHLRLDDHYLKILTMKEPPSQTAANLLHRLLEIPCSCIVVSEWQRQDNFAMRKLIQSKRRHHHNSKSSLMNYVNFSEQPTTPDQMLVDDSASAMVHDLGACLKEMEVNGNYFGKFSFTVILYDRRRDHVERAAAEAFKVFSTVDSVMIEERYNLLNAFLGALPGNGRYNLRYLYLLNTNYADLSFLFTSHCGEVWNRHLGDEYLAILETTQRNPYFLNLHYQDVAHTVILGRTGSGKSFFLNFLLTNLQKYKPATFIFDLGGSYEHLTRLFGGSYLKVGVERRAFSINPFRLERTKENLHFLFSFVKVLVEANGFRMGSDDERDVYAAVCNIYEVPAEIRRLGSLIGMIRKPLAQQLQRWCGDGQYGAVFDNEDDNLTLASFQAFDFEGMDKYPQVLEPLLFYVLHRANASIYAVGAETTFKAFVMDEAWRFLKNPTIKDYITEALKTWRKRNAALILATQSSEDLTKTDMLATVAESCATKIFLANPGMQRDDYRRIFHLNETEARLIAELLPKQQVLVKRPDMAKVLNLNVDPKGYWLYTNSPNDNRLRREAFERYGFELGLDKLAGSHDGSDDLVLNSSRS